MIKLELYKAYRTRGGWKAVVVDGPDEDGMFETYHANHGVLLRHLLDGKHEAFGERYEDIIAEWSEPRSGTMWLNIYPEANRYVVHETKDDAWAARSEDCVACKRVDWKEGEFDE